MASESAARELPNLSLQDALQLVHLYIERGSPKSEPAARRWLVLYLSEGSPSLRGCREGHGESCGGEVEAGGVNQLAIQATALACATS